ncbi:MAG: hypothetical protein KatS3mg076_1728 [Candidatus Binatia bacterium]|nr:MAG: hypothetical protein KatS3mg076_1728 [Candidatus Binatia bacterium]
MLRPCLALERLRTKVPEQTEPFLLARAASSLARRLGVDTKVLLSALLRAPLHGPLWSALRATLFEPGELRSPDWSEARAASRFVLAERSPAEGRFLCWLVQPGSPSDAFLLAAWLLTVHPRARVVATHSDPVVVETGRYGLVPAAVLAGSENEPIRTCFRRIGGSWRAKRYLRDAVRFVTLDVLDTPLREVRRRVPNPRLTVCRGLFSRLGPQAQERLAARLAGTLRKGSYLLLGAGEYDSASLGESFERCIAPGALLYRKTSTRKRRKSPDPQRLLAKLCAAVEKDPLDGKTRLRLARWLVERGYAEFAIVHLEEILRREPGDRTALRLLGEARTLTGRPSCCEA